MKVNAPVDRGVSGLVAALNEFPDIETIESCEGSQNVPAWVCFRYGRYWDAAEPWRELAEFVLGYLAPRLADAIGDAASLTIRARHAGTPLADLTARPEAVASVEAALRTLATEFSAHQHHKLACCDGTSDTSR